VHPPQPPGTSVNGAARNQHFAPDGSRIGSENRQPPCHYIRHCQRPTTHLRSGHSWYQRHTRLRSPTPWSSQPFNHGPTPVPSASPGPSFPSLRCSTRRNTAHTTHQASAHLPTLASDLPPSPPQHPPWSAAIRRFAAKPGGRKPSGPARRYRSPPGQTQHSATTAFPENLKQIASPELPTAATLAHRVSFSSTGSRKTGSHIAGAWPPRPISTTDSAGCKANDTYHSPSPCNPCRHEPARAADDEKMRQRPHSPHRHTWKTKPKKCSESGRLDFRGPATIGDPATSHRGYHQRNPKQTGLRPTAPPHIQPPPPAAIQIEGTHANQHPS